MLARKLTFNFKRHFGSSKIPSEGFTRASDLPNKESLLFETGDLKELAQKLSNNTYKNIAVMAGAGISVNAGIPDFRSPDSGLYSKLKDHGLPFPEAIFDINYFKMDPEPFFKLGPKLMVPDATPTPTHYFIKLLEQKGLLMMCYTQNIDGLEKKAGVSQTKLVRAHGHNESSHCTSCGKEYHNPSMRECLRKGQVAYCECGGAAKPDVVFFGEGLPWEFHSSSELLVYSDLLLIFGTSLAVFPFASLVDLVNPKVPRVIFSKQHSDSYIQGGFNFSPDSSLKRDLMFEGDCDQKVKQLVELAGWEKEFSSLTLKV